MFHVKHFYIISMTPNMLYAIKKVVHGEPEAERYTFMTIKEKLNLWVEITGVNPTEKVTSYTIRFDRLSRCDIEEMNKRLSESLETGNPVIINALLRGFLKQYADDSKLTFSDMLENKKVIMDKLALVERLHDSIIADEEETAFFSPLKTLWIIMGQISVWRILTLMTFHRCSYARKGIWLLLTEFSSEEVLSVKNLKRS